MPSWGSALPCAPVTFSAFVVTCEHGGNAIPGPYNAAFEGADAQAALASHRGWDPGTLEFARELSGVLKAPLFFSETSRLLIDLNRSLGHPRSFSEWSRNFDALTKQQIIDEHYTPHRTAITNAIAERTRARQRVLHLAIHSFTPIMDGVVRNAELGLLYDPARPAERALCAGWKKSFVSLAPSSPARLNYPYKGTSDGLTPVLRRQFSDAQYAGIEVEFNHGVYYSDRSRWGRLNADTLAALQATLSP